MKTNIDGIIVSSMLGVIRIHSNGSKESLIGHVSFGSPEGDRARALIPGPNYPGEPELRAVAEKQRRKSAGARW